MMRLLSLWIMACLLPVLTTAATPSPDTTDRDTLFTQARAALAEEKALEALTLTAQLLEQGDDAPELRLLVGNAHLLQSQLPEAALAYRHALHMDPTLSEAAQNLDFTLQALGTPAPPAPPTWQKIITFGPRTYWLLMTTLTGWLAAFLLLMAWFSRTTGRRSHKRWIVPSTACLFLALLGTGNLIARHLIADRTGIAAQLMSASPLLASPARSAAPVIEALVPGTEVRVLEEVGDWNYIEVPTGESGPLIRGWSRTEDTVPITP